MFNNSLKSRIYQYIKLRYPEWVHKGELGRLAVNEWGYENENMGRRCRELEEEGLIEVDYVKNRKGVRCAVYRLKKENTPLKFKDPSEMSQEELRALVQ